MLLRVLQKSKAEAADTELDTQSAAADTCDISDTADIEKSTENVHEL